MEFDGSIVRHAKDIVAAISGDRNRTRHSQAPRAGEDRRRSRPKAIKPPPRSAYVPGSGTSDGPTTSDGTTVPPFEIFVPARLVPWALKDTGGDVPTLERALNPAIVVFEPAKGPPVTYQVRLPILE